MENNNLGLTNVELARRLGVSEGIIRYHKRRQGLKKDGRKHRYSKVSKFKIQIEDWIQSNEISGQKYRDTILSMYIQLLKLCFFID